ncbi:MAG: TlpA family protein disulfide reductase [Caldilineaceae bacterium]|nr:TlpA family protein disulfide reductase [Caldilineaceae bacterium]
MLQKLNIRHLTIYAKPSFLDRWLRPALILILVVMTAAIINIFLTNFVFTGLSIGTSAPNFLGQTLDGEQFNLSERQGQPVMLTFWSPDCFACREELPALQALSTDPSADMQMITIVSQMDQADVVAFLAEQQLTFPVIVDETGLIAKQYKVSGIPFTYFIDQNGKIDRAVMGAGREGELQDQLFTWLRSCQIGEACSVE